MTPLKVLIVEDSDDDLHLLLNALKAGGLEPNYTRVQNGKDLSKALENESWQIVISDYSLPSFSAQLALEIVRPTQIPFFIVSGTIDETVAAKLMRAGAQDYVMKDNLTRLIPAIYRELDEAARRQKVQSQLQQTLDQFRQAQKMEAVGRLAGGVAHDFNNLLSVIFSYTDMIVEKLPSGDAVRNDIEQIRQAGQRAAALTRQLLTFSKQQPAKVRIIDVNATVNRMHDIWQRVLGKNITVELNLAKDLPHLTIDESQLEQTLMNLIVNARDAMSVSGCLKIKTFCAELKEPKTTVHSKINPGRYVVLSVQDNGSGMDSAIQEQIFEPFFTTKGDKGTGLGLATVFGIVHAAGGHIHVESKKGVGSTFEIYFPETLPRS